MAQDNSLWNSMKTALKIPLMADVGGTVTVKEEGGIGGYELTIRQEESIKLQNSITDYYTEDNSSIQDNIALKPITFSIDGIVGEKFLDVKTATTYGETISNVLGPVLAYLPDVTDYVFQALIAGEAILKSGEKAIEEASETINKLFGGPTKDSETTLNKQEQAFLFFYSAYKARELMEVELPWCSLNNCAITSVELSQPAETRSYTNIKISFKQMNFASTLGSSGGVGRRKAQSGGKKNTNLSKTGDSVQGKQAPPSGGRKIN